jgi:hypothetical protein
VRALAALDADDVEVRVDVDGDGRTVGLRHVRFVLRVTVRVGLDPDDRAARDLGLRRGRDLGESVAGQERLIAPLVTPRLTAARRLRGAAGVVVAVVVPDPFAALAMP